MDNREIDVLVAKEVMGLDVEPSSNYDGWYEDLIPIGNREFIDPEGWVYDKGRKAVPNFSTYIAATLMVVEKLAEQGYLISIHDNGNTYAPCWDVRFVMKDDDSKRGMAIEATIPHAVCLAALNLKGVDISALRREDS